ncbi:MAG: autotransporter assembly complex protein TamA [Nevskia sp.]|nr:autotransporter assembly complex protein TamA [Nevskia sp.]
MPRARLLLLCGVLCASAPAFAGIDVRVRGLGSDEQDNAYAQLRILDYAKSVDAAKEQYDEAEVRRLLTQGEDDIRKALQPFGWYNPTVKSGLQGGGQDWTATYTVDAGPPVLISRIDIRVEGEGKDYAPLQKVVSRPRLQTGQRLKHPDYEALKARLLQAATGGGYLDAAFTRRELRVDVEANTAEVLLALDTGPRWYFGDVTIEQDGRLQDRLLRRYLKIVPGEPFDSSKVLATQFALSDLDYFKLVELEPQKGKAGPDRRIPVVIHTSSKPPRVYKFGAGYGTDTGPRALAGMEFRRLNEKGHKLRLTLQPSQNISTAVAEYRVPYGSVPGDSISFTGQGLKQDFQGIHENLWSLGTAYTRQDGDWQRRYYLVYSADQYNLQSEPGNSSKLLTPGVSFSRTQVNDPIYPRRGWFASMDVHGGSTVLLSDTDFIEGLLKLRGVIPLGPGLRLLGRLEEGAVFVSGFDNLPPSQRFFAGGDESVRGYSYHALAPRDPQGNLVGGRYLTTASAEVDWQFYRNYGLAAFADAGGVDDVPEVKLHYGAGLGFRYRLPFGSVAVDLAHPFDPGAEIVHLHLGVRVGL